MAFVATKNNNVNLSALREKRNALLQLTDKYVVLDSPLGDFDLDLVKAYRAALRNCTHAAPGQIATLPQLDSFMLPPKIRAELENFTGL